MQLDLKVDIVTEVGAIVSEHKEIKALAEERVHKPLGIGNQHLPGSREAGGGKGTARAAHRQAELDLGQARQFGVGFRVQNIPLR